VRGTRSKLRVVRTVAIARKIKISFCSAAMVSGLSFDLVMRRPKSLDIHELTSKPTSNTNIAVNSRPTVSTDPS